VVRKGERWSGRGPGGPEGGPVVGKGGRGSGRGPVVREGGGGPEGGPVVRKGERWSGRDPGTAYVQYIYVPLGKVTVKFALEQATKAQTGRRGIALLFL